MSICKSLLVTTVLAASSAALGMTPIIAPLSVSGHDRLFGVAFDTAGKVVATGVIADSTDASADHATAVVRFLANGARDPSFGTSGLARLNLAVGTNGELSRGIALQSTGKILVSATVEHAGGADARDRDMAVARLNTDGTLDTTFGTNGIVVLDITTGAADGTTYVADSNWGVSTFANDEILVSGASKARDRVDSDFTLVKLTADGNLDYSFGVNGIFTLDVGGTNASPRNATILPDGTIVGSGYASIDAVVRPILYKLTANGTLDPSFGTGGVLNQPLLTQITEAYSVAVQGTSFVTAGYGRNLEDHSIDWVSLRITADGQVDRTYGDDGVARVDVANFNDNARSLVVLPDGRPLLVGGGRPTATNVDAMITVLTYDGRLDASFAQGGVKLLDFGGASDFFWAVAVSQDQKRVAMVGVKGNVAGSNDDAALLLIDTP